MITDIQLSIVIQFLAEFSYKLNYNDVFAFHFKMCIEHFGVGKEIIVNYYRTR